MLWQRFVGVSVLNREPMWLKLFTSAGENVNANVSVLNREPMWLKSCPDPDALPAARRFSAQP